MGTAERDPPFPFELGPVSNGEFAPPRPTERALAARRATLDDAERTARRLGMDRRRFLLTLGGAATMLLALDACSRDDAARRGERPGGTFTVPPEATTEPEAAAELLLDDVPVMDVQTHLLDYTNTDNASEFGLGFPQSRCGLEDPRSCFGLDVWLDEVYGRSDTAVAALSALPILADPHPQDIDVMERAREAVETRCGDGRLLLHGQVNPNVGDTTAALAEMADIVETHRIAAWKVYTHVGEPPWSFDDHDPSGALVGHEFLDRVSEIGPDVVCVHKGLGDPYWASPRDLGPAALEYPDIRFVAYHSGYESGLAEGPYVPGVEHRGVDRLVETAVEHGPGGGRNIYAELGSTWFLVMSDPDQAAHVLGKLLVALGPDRILWGTDSIWYGSPQEQIETFRAFQITDEFQERYGYPALTDEVKAKILGGNAAELYGVDLAELSRCAPSADEADSERVAAGPRRTYGPRTVAEAKALFEAETARLA